MIDLIVRGDERDIAVEDGVIAGIAPEIGEPAREEVDARGETAAVPTSEELTDRLSAAVAAVGQPVEHLPSGAGHDGVAMAAITPIAMLFVRCERGISHNPAEKVEAADVEVALDVLERFVSDLA